MSKTLNHNYETTILIPDAKHKNRDREFHKTVENRNYIQMKAEDLKLVVQEKYGAIAKQRLLLNQASCCGTSGCCGNLDIKMIGDEYQSIEGHHRDADLGLGCGIPTQFAAINTGDHVLDLGSGAGNDCFVARAIVGDKGKVTGIDFTDAMIEKAIINNNTLGYSNVEFIKGDIENMPLPDNRFDVVVSNCVLNLVPDKGKAFAEIMRVLIPGGHFCVSDVILKGELPEKLKNDLEMYAGCVSGAIEESDYLNIIVNQGFTNVTIHQMKQISIPVDILEKYLKRTEIDEFGYGERGIFSITVSGCK
jgi:arsenite methyltransferase